MIPNDEFNRRRNSRSVITAIGLVALVVLIFAITMTKMHHGG